MTNASVQLEEIRSERLLIPIIGTSPLIVNRFSEKAKRKMLDNMQGRKTLREVRDPQADYEGCFYRFADDGYGFPCIGFKAATVATARFYGKELAMTDLRQFLFFKGDVGLDGQMLVRIEGEPKMREDVVRLSSKSTDLRYRPEFPDWSATLDLVYVTSSLSRTTVLSLVDAGGLGVGVGEWRPEKSGDFGTYQVDPSREVQVLS